MGGNRNISSNWDGEMCCLDFDGIQVEVLNALSHLSANLDSKNYNSLGLGPGLDVVAETRDLLTGDIPEYEEVTHSILISKDYVHHVQLFKIKLCGQKG